MCRAEIAMRVYLMCIHGINMYIRDVITIHLIIIFSYTCYSHTQTYIDYNKRQKGRRGNKAREPRHNHKRIKMLNFPCDLILLYFIKKLYI